MLTRIFTRILATTLMLVSVSGAAGAQEGHPLTIGQPEVGFLDTVGRWSFEAGTGQVVRVTAESDAFDTVIQLRSPAGEVLAENDDCSVTTNSCLETTIPLAGRYEIWVTAFFNGTGLYTVAVQTVTAMPLTTSTATTSRLGEDDQTVERGSFEAGARNVMAARRRPLPPAGDGAPLRRCGRRRGLRGHGA